MIIGLDLEIRTIQTNPATLFEEKQNGFEKI